MRRATLADARAAADLWLRARVAAAAAATIPPPVHDDDDVRGWFATRVVPAGETWLAHDNTGALVGLLVLDGFWLEQLYVEPTAQGQGVGSQLLDLARVQRPGGMQLWTFAANLGARRLYERAGFREVRRTDGENEEGAPDILYAWGDPVADAGPGHRPA